MKYRMNILLMSGPRNQATHVALAPIEVGIELGASRAPGKRKLKPMPDDTNPLVRIVSLKLQDIGCFEHIDLYFASQFNLLCGANGVGKSTILAVIGRAFSQHQSELRRRAAAQRPGHWHALISVGESPVEAQGEAGGFMPTEQDEPQQLAYQSSKSLLYFKANRDFVYSRLEAISRDPIGEIIHSSASAVTGVDQTDLKRWIANRYLFSRHPGSLTEWQIANFDFAKRCFSILDPRIEFSSVEATTFDTYVQTPQGRVPFEYLSSGFRASLAMLLGIIREIEIRGFGINAHSFSGIILVDEIDLHLHPTWQRLIVTALKEAFPFAQFIATTHSPHMIQNAELGEVIALIDDGSAATRLGDFNIGKYGFKGWSVEEILRDVMGLKDTTSEAFSNAMLQFDSAIEREDSESVRFWLYELESMIHPANHLRKLLRLQAAPIEGLYND